MIDKDRINNTLGKMAYYLGNHNNILVSVSGGSDSDIIVHIIATYFRQYLHKIHFVFVNTGLEYQATKDHLVYLEKTYNIQIERIRGKSVVWAVHTHGVPVQSKSYSHLADLYRRGLQSGIKWRNGGYNKPEFEGKGGHFSCNEKESKMADAIKQRDIKVSSKCCDVSKKQPLFNFMKTHNIDLDITGERKAEGGQRAVRHKNCFEPNNHGIDKYMPLFFWNDDTKQYYKETENIRYSDCYEVWGMKRTGCVGCPFGSRTGRDDLQRLSKYEPQLFKAVLNVFGESYRLTDEFHIHRKQYLDWMNELPQETLFDIAERNDE